MSVDWYQVFALSMSPLELLVRGSAIYLFLLAALRFFMQRDVGAVGLADLLVLVLIADAAQNAMAGEYRSVGDGLVLLSTILGWNVLFDYLAFRFPKVRRILQPPALKLVHRGRILSRNLRREFISQSELYAKLREHGISHLSQVQAAFMESDGTISVIRRSDTAGDDEGEDGGNARDRPL
ncbi:DUF421 domain-containing protein [Azoarcus indigens]|uniref:Uncharacterized protein DUF421 n=1 Tax=Azoarcus indigens TaxID=29545 RepID=A0A4R6EF21_9RHOO|nr:YetF domain-containing protein [Azoarcus indigens]NMG64265.1 DUF421 domain-containing protein [Azoarcus indigens]TDN55858.1 uncharacterized protein DUF421 [Azoarcus indigens]